MNNTQSLPLTPGTIFVSRDHQVRYEIIDTTKTLAYLRISTRMNDGTYSVSNPASPFRIEPAPWGKGPSIRKNMDDGRWSVLSAPVSLPVPPPVDSCFR